MTQKNHLTLSSTYLSVKYLVTNGIQWVLCVSHSISLCVYVNIDFNAGMHVCVLVSVSKRVIVLKAV